MNSDIIWQLLRYGGLAIGGYFVKKGLLTDDSLTTILAAIGTLGTAVWGVYVKWNTKATTADVAAKPSVPTVSAATGAVSK